MHHPSWLLRRDAEKLASGCLATFLESWDLSPDLSAGLCALPLGYSASPAEMNISSFCLKIVYSPQSTVLDKETKVQRGPVTCSWSHN